MKGMRKPKIGRRRLKFFSDLNAEGFQRKSSTFGSLKTKMRRIAPGRFWSNCEGLPPKMVILKSSSPLRKLVIPPVFVPPLDEPEPVEVPGVPGALERPYAARLM